LYMGAARTCVAPVRPVERVVLRGQKKRGGACECGGGQGDNGSVLDGVLGVVGV
jgi:hypothetical protein